MRKPVRNLARAGRSVNPPREAENQYPSSPPIGVVHERVDAVATFDSVAQDPSSPQVTPPKYDPSWHGSQAHTFVTDKPVGYEVKAPHRRQKLKIVPLTLKQANDLVKNWHRHHKPVVGHRFSIGLEVSGELVGAAIVGRAQGRMTPQYNVASVTRLVTNGTKNACSKLYGACARIAREMGFEQIRTELLEDEPGTTMIAAGWTFSHMTDGGDWNRPSRGGRRTDQPMCKKQVWVKELNAEPRTGEGS